MLGDTSCFLRFPIQYGLPVQTPRVTTNGSFHPPAIISTRTSLRTGCFGKRKELDGSMEITKYNKTIGTAVLPREEYSLCGRIMSESGRKTGCQCLLCNGLMYSCQDAELCVRTHHAMTINILH